MGFLRNHTPQRDAFSLIEVLAVCAVIAVIAAILAPALLRARDSSLSAQCTGNLRQVGFAAQLYWDDHGRTFAERILRTNGGWCYWFGWLADGGEGDREFDPTRGPMWPYLQERKVSICPSLNRASPNFKPKSRGAAYGYAYNLLVGPRGSAGSVPSTFRQPAGLAVFTDGGQVNDFQAPASAERPMLEEFYYFDTNRLSATVHFRHARRAQVWFADGHVAPARPDPDSLDRRLAGEVIGRLPADLVTP
jgi:prepilin-type processing-associated H-X9-DG protein/prepilin-type N-terminal cleavage/methylation domain-containing protein